MCFGGLDHHEAGGVILFVRDGHVRDQAARERTLRELFTAHADALRRASLDDETAALADEREIEMVDAEVYGSGRATR